jgi:hypothetical protein
MMALGDGNGDRGSVIADRAGWARHMVEAIRDLLLDAPNEFMEDHRNVAAAEYDLRRGLEATGAGPCPAGPRRTGRPAGKPVDGVGGR